MRIASDYTECSVFENAKCILYQGPYLEFLNINTGESMEVALVKLNAWLLLNVSTTTTTTTTHLV